MPFLQQRFAQESIGFYIVRLVLQNMFAVADDLVDRLAFEQGSDVIQIRTQSDRFSHYALISSLACTPI